MWLWQTLVYHHLNSSVHFDCSRRDSKGFTGTGIHHKSNILHSAASIVEEVAQVVLSNTTQRHFFSQVDHAWSTVSLTPGDKTRGSNSSKKAPGPQILEFNVESQSPWPLPQYLHHSARPERIQGNRKRTAHWPQSLGLQHGSWTAQKQTPGTDEVSPQVNEKGYKSNPILWMTYLHFTSVCSFALLFSPPV